jgi:uncharacterized NAD(P)/FAD-binding protein YdhS
MQRPEVAVIGAGFSGVLTALSILEADATVRVQLIERADRFGVGAAYGTLQPDHLLNVRAANMSADPTRPDDFMLWLSRQRGAAADAFAFASRAEYGLYIQARLRRIAQSEAGADRLELSGDEVLAMTPGADGLKLQLAMGRELRADVVVLATGNARPSDDVLPDPGFRDSPAYVRDPWSGALDAIGPDDPVLVLGTGLTMIDVIARLDAQGHQGRLLALSRRGLTPRIHARISGEPDPWRRAPAESLSRGLNRFRREAEAALDWRVVFDALRPTAQELWKGLSHAERGRFLRHLQPWWEAHRHRLAPAMAARLEAWRAGRLRLAAGRLVSLAAVEDGVVAAWRPRGEDATQHERVRFVVNCTGPEGDPTQSDQPLIRQLLKDGLVRADAFGLGLDVTEDNRLIGSGGAPHETLFAIGPAARGALWEVTAVPDIRVQARGLGGRAARAAEAKARPPQNSGARVPRVTRRSDRA